jgi:hypothetical protein
MNQNQLDNAPAPRSVDQQQACSALVATEKNYKSIQRKMLGELVRRTQPGFPPQDGRCEKIKKAIVFIPDAGGMRFRTPLVSSFGDTFEIIIPLPKPAAKDPSHCVLTQF